jgi:hypothetical protein
MSIFDPSQGNAPELFVPDLRKPAGAAIDADGNVTCVTCGTKLAMARADVVGQGYRCPPCTGKAHVEALSNGTSDAAANLNPAEREAMYSSGQKLLGTGIAAIIGGVCLFLIGLPRAGGFIFIAGLAGAGSGYSRMRGAR